MEWAGDAEGLEFEVRPPTPFVFSETNNEWWEGGGLGYAIGPSQHCMLGAGGCLKTSARKKRVKLTLRSEKSSPLASHQC